MKDFFKTASPEAMGIATEHIDNFLTRLENLGIPLHSAIIMRNDRIVSEVYYEPYTRDSLHRMFSVTKSFVSLAIGLLMEEGKLSLDDKIVDYFPDKLGGNTPHPYLAALTIRDMLRMATCHESTTYKVMNIPDWTATFFLVPPNHIPGTAFAYDTSSTHVLCALVERLSGMTLLDYMRTKFLDELDFSKNAYCITDPSGTSMGGSGLLCTPYDVLKVFYVVAHEGAFMGKQLLPKEYVKEAVSFQIDTRGKGQFFEEMQGYGYQIWRTTHNGFAFYGMGGQLALYLPDEDLFMITTADTQGRQGGVQMIYDAFYGEIVDKLGTPDASCDDITPYTATRQIIAVKGDYTSPIADAINNKTYVLDQNQQGFTSIRLSLDDKCLYYTLNGTDCCLPFNMGLNAVTTFPVYNRRCAVSGAFRTEDTFLIKAHIIDECVGNVTIQLTFKEKGITVMLRKFEETYFNEYNGFISGKEA